MFFILRCLLGTEFRYLRFPARRTGQKGAAVAKNDDIGAGLHWRKSTLRVWTEGSAGDEEEAKVLFSRSAPSRIETLTAPLVLSFVYQSGLTRIWGAKDGGHFEKRNNRAISRVTCAPNGEGAQTAADTALSFPSLCVS